MSERLDDIEKRMELLEHELELRHTSLEIKNAGTIKRNGIPVSIRKKVVKLLHDEGLSYRAIAYVMGYGGSSSVKKMLERMGR